MSWRIPVRRSNSAVGGGAGSPPPQLDFAKLRQAMVSTQLQRRGIADPRVLVAMGTVPREEFVPDALRGRAYADSPQPLDGATISQPYIVAYMIELARVAPGDRVLEIGTGSGYQAAVLSEMGADVSTIEISPMLAFTARRRLEHLGYERVHVRRGDGYSGWPERAPFDAILVTAGLDHIPQPLVRQLVEGGRLVIPVGPRWGQTLTVGFRTGDALEDHPMAPVAFVPFTHPA